MLSKKADLIIGALSKLINYLKDSQKRSIFNSIIEISFITVLLYRCFVVEHEKIQSKLLNLSYNWLWYNVTNQEWYWYDLWNEE